MSGNNLPDIGRARPVFLAALCVFFILSYATDGCAEGPSIKKDYWGNGKIKQERIYDSAGKLAATMDYRRDGTVDKYEKFDGGGNKIAEAHYGADGRLANNPVDNWAAMRWKYKDGRLVSESYYGEDGRLKERKEYSESGNLIAKQYVDDGDIDESEEFNTEFMAPEEMSEYYDPNGRFLGEMDSFR